ncbi:hypothetical protein IEQ44_05935 [Nocardioides sp. Y6]|uniref:Restriction endonuclease subunit S n=1 Tax=Nocardioides malaquae TaxID=2773426 RepID=A0ABR9RRJ1_9ACTN|nr:hypothetical protein [Nocardioides malaquae]MBE7324186.1 hypothetical protein [Nocardioides malaquae]
MSLNLDKSAWKRVRLGDVIRRSRRQVDPFEVGVERYVAGGHIDGDSITIDRWGDAGDGQMGSTFRYVFEARQVLFVSARPYLRKCGIVDFSGVVADKTYVLDAIPETGLLQEFLPFVLASDAFIAYATAEATGSMNPRLLWGPFQRYEFDLPPLDEQKRIADLLWAMERHKRALWESRDAALAAHRVWLDETIKGLDKARHRTVGELIAAKELTLLTGPFGSTLSAKEFIEGGIPVIHPSHIREGRATADPRSTLPPIRAEELKRWQVAAGDIVMMRKGDVGRSAIITPEQAGWIISSDCISIRLSEDASLSPEFLRLALSAPTAMATLLRNAPGTTMPGINERSLQTISVPALDDSEQSSMIEKSQRLESLTDRLRTERDAVTEACASVLAEVFGGN